MSARIGVMILVSIAAGLLALPVATFLYLYFKMFCRTTRVTKDEATEKMNSMYVESYGRRHFCVPFVLMMLIALTILYIAVSSAAALVTHLDVLFPLNQVSMCAVAGAYTWVANDLIARARRLDFSPSDVNWCSLRLAIAVPLGLSLSALAEAHLANFIAFAAGAFPLATLMDIFRRSAASRLGYQQATQLGDEIVKLQGVDESIATRLVNEDIATITQVAYCDPIRLTMRSGLHFNVVTDLMNQALAWQYLGEGLDKVRPLGVRGAVEVKHLLDAFEDKDSDEHAMAVAAIPEIAKALEQSVETLMVAFAEIAGDPFALHLDSIWD